MKVRIDPPAVRALAYHKPSGEVVTLDDPQNRPTAFRRLPSCTTANGSLLAVWT